MQFPMTVIVYCDDQPSLTVIDINDCDFIENEGRRLIYHIGDEKYYQIVNKSEMENLLEKEGFKVLDRPYLVNMDHIARYDEKLNKVYFKETLTKNDKYATVARDRRRLIKSYLQKKIIRNGGQVE